MDKVKLGKGICDWCGKEKDNVVDGLMTRSDGRFDGVFCLDCVDIIWTDNGEEIEVVRFDTMN